MSGGSYDYAFSKLEDLADEIEKYAHQGKLPLATRDLRLAFAVQLRLMATAAHDIEWVDSGDCSEGDEIEAIRAALGPARQKEKKP